jgi:hypothetical protein
MEIPNVETKRNKISTQINIGVILIIFLYSILHPFLSKNCSNWQASYLHVNYVPHYYISDGGLVNVKEALPLPTLISS